MNKIIKIILLGFSLAMGIVLIAKVYFEQSYENFTPDLNRVFYIKEDVENEGKPLSHGRTPGAIAPGLKEYSASIEIATRYTEIKSNLQITDENKNIHAVESIIIADSCLFDIFQRKTIAGNLKDALSIKNSFVASSSWAKNLSDNPRELIGKVFNILGIKMVLSGIYQDFPQNSMFNDNPLIASINSTDLLGYDGTNNWMGNDRYMSIIKLYKEYNLDEIKASITKMCNDNYPMEDLEKKGIKFSYSIEPLSYLHTREESVRTSSILLTIIAFVLILSAVLNYVLISLSIMVKKAKTIAVLKCYGANRINIYIKFIKETLIDLLLSLFVSLILIISCSNFVEYLIGNSVLSLLQGNILLIILAIFILVFTFCALIPAYIYSKIPVATAFRRYKESSKRWKHFLLFIQFTLSMLFITLFIIFLLQYQKVIKTNPGYDYKELHYVELVNLSNEQRQLLNDKITQLPFIESSVFSSCLPMDGANGNNIYIPGNEKEIMNIADMYYVSEGYFKLMNIPIIEGRNFKEDEVGLKEIMVSRKFKEKMAKLAGWTDGCIGKNIIITEHSNTIDNQFVICGVYEDYLIGTYNSEDIRASVQFFASKQANLYSHFEYLMLKFKNYSADNFNTTVNLIHNLLPDKELNLNSYNNNYTKLYDSSKRVRDAVILATIVILIITLIGVMAYSRDEVNRRTSEISIRKINGASIKELLVMINKKIMILSCTSIIIGGTAAYYVSGMLLELFSKKIALSWYIFIGCGCATLALILGISLLTTYKKANVNPVENLKNE